MRRKRPHDVRSFAARHALFDILEVLLDKQTVCTKSDAPLSVHHTRVRRQPRSYLNAVGLRGVATEPSAFLGGSSLNAPPQRLHTWRACEVHTWTCATEEERTHLRGDVDGLGVAADLYPASRAGVHVLLPNGVAVARRHFVLRVEPRRNGSPVPAQTRAQV